MWVTYRKRIREYFQDFKIKLMSRRRTKKRNTKKSILFHCICSQWKFPLLLMCVCVSYPPEAQHSILSKQHFSEEKWEPLFLSTHTRRTSPSLLYPPYPFLLFTKIPCRHPQIHSQDPHKNSSSHKTNTYSLFPSFFLINHHPPSHNCVIVVIVVKNSSLIFRFNENCWHWCDIMALFVVWRCGVSSSSREGAHFKGRRCRGADFTLYKHTDTFKGIFFLFSKNH